MEKMSFILRRAVYPNHVCCQAVYPDLKDVNVIKGIRISDISLKTQNWLNSYKIYLSDTIIDSRFTLAKQIILGDQVSISEKEVGSNREYRIWLSQTQHVEGDPKYHCYNYQKPGEYDECLEAEMIKQIKRKLDCVPPWITDDKVTLHIKHIMTSISDWVWVRSIFSSIRLTNYVFRIYGAMLKLLFRGKVYLIGMS